MNKQLFLTVLLLSLIAPVNAITDSERTTLLRASNEIDFVISIVEEAQQSINENDRRTINYQKLKEELQIIKQGIHDAIDEPRREPRSLPPIEGDY